MKSLRERVGKARFDQIDGAYILISARKREDTVADYFCKANISFLYDAGEYAAEWEPEYGPIQIWHKCNADAENAKEHYFYEYTDSGGLNWSQLAVERSGLPQAFVSGDYKYIFAVLKDWARDS